MCMRECLCLCVCVRGSNLSFGISLTQISLTLVCQRLRCLHSLQLSLVSGLGQAKKRISIASRLGLSRHRGRGTWLVKRGRGGATAAAVVVEFHFRYCHRCCCCRVCCFCCRFVIVFFSSRCVCVFAFLVFGFCSFAVSGGRRRVIEMENVAGLRASWATEACRARGWLRTQAEHFHTHCKRFPRRAQVKTYYATGNTGNK